MNCFNHPVEVAVATCQDCGKGLCENCSTQYEFPICQSCNLQRLRNDKSYIIKDFAMIFGIGSVLFYIIYSFINSSDRIQNHIGFFTWVMYYYACCSIVAGWRFLNKITPSIFLFLPLIGWLIYFVIKYLISVFIGPLVLPYRIYQNIKRYFS